MKFQIILSSTGEKAARLADDELEKYMAKVFKSVPGFKLVGARSLDGIRQEMWEPARKFPPAQPSVRDLQKRVLELEAEIKRLKPQPKRRQRDLLD